MQTTDELKQILKDEGFVHIFEWRDEPGTEYPKHAHKGKSCMYILSGEITMWLDGKETDLKEGDRFDVPVGKEHSVKVGSGGCYYLMGEMIEGGSYDL